ncbi:endosialidase catalytic beta-propeller domain-containing protein [Sinorhizobium fredii]|uniref:Bacteriophage endosialidase protein n=1 Tax=Rhizobium fredii TaxID=380 RepID=A0A2L0H6M7_RHIFR|nr:endosialidase catalytic beta-propeller domain-containing protein [Sinorhizobium fredii]AUX76419.1 bacteriophage endosialidase protein [Sinorhizobium fredii]
MAKTASEIWADGPSSDPYQPPKDEIREWGGRLETGGWSFGTKALAQAASVPADIHVINLLGGTSVGDGQGGQYIDTNNGSSDTFTTVAPSARTWYRAEDVGVDRLSNEAAIRNWLDPLKNFNANGTTDDTANFAALEAVMTGREIDCKGLVFKVTAIPTGNNYRHGFFAKSNGEATNPKDVLYPMEGTFVAESYKLTSSRRHDGWPQDKWHEYDGVIFAVWNQGSTHSSDDLHVCMARSYDGGRTFIDFERLFQKTGLTGGVTSWAAGIVDGQQVVIVRESETATEHRLYCRRVGQKKKITATLSSPASGTAGWELIFSRHGCRSGNKIKFNANVSIGGTTIVAGTEYTVSSGSATRIVFTGPSSSSAQTIAGDYVIEFVESGWTEINWTGVALGTHLVNTSADQTGQPTMFHSFAGVPASGGDFYTCVHGGAATAGPTLIMITDLLSNSPTLAKYNKITTANRVEATLDYDEADGYLYGFGRTQFTDQSPLAWWSSDGGDTFNTNIGGPVGALQYSPFPCKIVGDTIYAYGSANRAGTDDVSGNYVKTEVPLYLFRGSKSAFRTNYWAALQMIEIGTAYKYSDYAGLNVVGVGSMVVFNGNLILAHSTDNEDPGLGTGIPDIEMVRIRLEDEVIEDHGYQKLVGRSISGGVPALATYDKLYAERVVGSSTFQAVALINSDGTITSNRGGFGVTCTKVGTGDYTVTITNPKATTLYFPFVQPVGSGARRHEVLSLAAGSFNVKTFGYNNATPTDSAFVVGVIMLEDWTRTSWT